MSESQPATTGTKQVLIATVIAGGLGYLVQTAVGVFAAGSYLAFGVLWSATYLVVSCLAGLQQEITRASHAGPSGTGATTWARFTLLSAVVTAIVVTGLFALIGAKVFPDDTVTLVAAVVVAAVGYALVASISGALYGIRAWNGVAAMTITDAVLRALAVGTALLLGGGTLLLGWAVAVPFVIAAIAVWAVFGRSIRSSLVLDVDLTRLLRNAAATLVASLAMGLLISGFPLLLSLFASDAGDDLVRSLMLVITLTRAPLVTPVIALQGVLLVNFRDAGPALVGRVLRWTAILLVAIVVIAAVAAALGPLIMDAVFPAYLRLSALDFAVIVLSGGLTGVICVTGQALLAGSAHAGYTAGWIVAALVTIGALLVPIDAHTRVMIALLAGPTAGAVTHVLVLLTRRRASAQR